jgi:hypothetical protein
LLSSLSLTIAQFEIDYDVAMEENEEMRRSRCVALIGQERRRYDAMRWFIARLIYIDELESLVVTIN